MPRAATAVATQALSPRSRCSKKGRERERLTSGLSIDQRALLQHSATYYQTATSEGGRPCQFASELGSPAGARTRKRGLLTTAVNGYRHIETFGRKKDADAREAEVTVNVGKGIHIASNKSVTVDEAGELWIKACEGGRIWNALRSKLIVSTFAFTSSPFSATTGWRN